MKMLHYFSQLFAIFFLTLGSLAAAENSSMQKMDSSPIGIYFGGFGGWGFVQPDVAQKGTAFISENSGGALGVNASGKSQTSDFGFGGLHVGYEWSSKNERSWCFVPAAELEGYYFANTVTANIENPTTRLDLHKFKDSFPTRTGIFIADAILALKNKYIIPYVGAGVGVGIISIHRADSLQTDPLEANINHFNSDRRSYDSSFAAQIKAGLRYSIFKYMRIFAEYRYLYISPAHFIFGSTVYPTHVTTTAWNVRVSDLQYNLFSLGIDFTF